MMAGEITQEDLDQVRALEQETWEAYKAAAKDSSIDRDQVDLAFDHWKEILRILHGYERRCGQSGGPEDAA